MASLFDPMLTDQAYVQEQLDRIGHAGWGEVSKRTRIPMRTIKRVGYRENVSFRSDTIGKLAIYFRTRDKRR